MHSVHTLGMPLARARNGLPKIIPSVHRRRIIQGDRALLRLWLSWFSIYRVLTFPSVLKLSTITDRGVDLSALWGEMGGAINSFLSVVFGLSKGRTLYGEPEFRSLVKTTPSITSGRNRVSWSPEGIACGARALLASEVLPAFRQLLGFLPQGSNFRTVWMVMEKTLLPNPSSPVGKLGLKLEPAGKVRVFAMVECWTQ